MVSQPIVKQQGHIRTIFLIAAWFLGNIWTFQWFLSSLKYISALNLIVLGIVVTFLLVQLGRNSFFQLESITPRLNLYPLCLMIGGEIGAICLKWLINIPQLTFFCFILGSYGLLGLFMAESTWRKGLTITAIAACVIPFSTAFNSGLGFPVRVLTAHAVANTLTSFNLSAVSSHDIILMENGIAQVDLPCSGMKSLWTGTVFLLGATWLERRQLGWRWLLVAIANLLFLVIANIVRVLALVVIIEVWQQPQIAHILHLPLGIIGFIFASVITWIFLQKVPRHIQKESAIQPANHLKQKSNLNWLLPLVIVLGLIGQIKPSQISPISLDAIALPPAIVTENLQLTPAEANFFDNPANPLVQKLRFQSDQLSGSMLMVASNSWQSHHPPELCFLGNGFKVDNMKSKLISDSIHARWLSLQDGNLSATYWFQSDQDTTDDFISRIWEHITHKNKTWVLISVLFDEKENPNSAEIQDFARNIYQTVNKTLNIKY
ncbi:Transmembrane exosortase [Xenococcus sp. PCC 7305]|uniref:exosortase O n=1 Tax=Xenococcus sp. PCC 7305 TaxID=102125 RepID=UPI0002ABBBAB|nr:exosortase O [Xenococcus sp. PCC 7305]ELS03539.1 Transmembrane exosortase [Xenococcus sp. PCC 7305]